jgi:hypothetical protein
MYCAERVQKLMGGGEDSDSIGGFALLNEQFIDIYICFYIFFIVYFSFHFQLLSLIAQLLYFSQV